MIYNHYCLICPSICPSFVHHLSMNSISIVTMSHKSAAWRKEMELGHDAVGIQAALAKRKEAGRSSSPDSEVRNASINRPF